MHAFSITVALTHPAHRAFNSFTVAGPYGCGTCPEHAVAHAELIASGVKAAVIGGWVLFVLGCVGFVSAGCWAVHSCVHRRDQRRAKWVLPAIEDQLDVR